MTTETVVTPVGPPVNRHSPASWAKANLFNSAANTVISVVLLALSTTALFLSARWIIDAEWEIIRRGLTLAMVGQFPRDELWRVWICIFLFVTAIGFGSGTLARSGHETALEQGLESERESWGSLFKRFWTLLAISVFFVSFARTLPPYLGLAGAVVLAIVAREIGWRAGKSVRERGLFISIALLFAALIALSGTSTLGGLAFGGLAFVWASVEVRRRDLPGGIAGAVRGIGIPLVVAVVVFFVEKAISFDGYGWDRWGGLHVALFVTMVGIGLGMPFGILLALGRQSNLPAIRVASVFFIEFVRGVPLISLLFFSNLLLRLFFPLGMTIPSDLTMAMILITAFSAAYIAEIVRGGLQAVPRGQTEGGQAIGLSAAKVQRLIVLPQALRAVIPAMVGQFISLFKDTSLLSIIGIIEFMSFPGIINNQPEFLGKELSINTYLFVAIGYWAIAYTMSTESRRLETKLGVGIR